jgi:ABC-type oligopeptide transport system substrate-binding subunit
MTLISTKYSNPIYVGIDMDIQVMDQTAFSAYTTADKHVAMSYQLTTNINYPPMVWINQYTSRHYIFRGHINDPAYDKMWNDVKAITDIEQQKKMIIQMNDYATAQFYRLTTQPFNYFVMWQPWLKGYNGALTRDSVLGVATRTMWLDQALKKSMGY